MTRTNIGGVGVEIDTQKLQNALSNAAIPQSTPSKKENGINKLRNNMKKCIQGANRTVIQRAADQSSIAPTKPQQQQSMADKLDPFANMPKK